MKYKLIDRKNDINIVSDAGSENKGSLLEWIHQAKAPPVVRKLTAKTPDFPFSNSMSESTHSIYKSEFMQGTYSLDVKQHIKDLDRFMVYYNLERYPTEHYGLRPNEVLQGEKPHKNRFKEHFKKAKEERVNVNKLFNDCPFVCLPR